MEVKEAKDVTLNRERGIGGSDVAAVMGISPFTSRFDLLKYKAGFKENEFKGSIYTEYGDALEPKIRDYVNTLGYDFKPDYIETETDKPLSLYDHCDGLDGDRDVVLEIKTTSTIHKTVDEYKYYLVQLLYGMKLYGCSEGVLAVYSRPDDMNENFDKSRLQVFFIGEEDYEHLSAEIDYAISQFRVDFLYLCENPFAEEADLPSRSTLVPVAEQMMRLEDAIAGAQAIVKQYDDLKKQMCKAMEQHGIKSWTMPNGTKVTLVPKGQDKVVQKFDETRFKAEHGDLYAEYQSDRIQKGKSSYVRVSPKTVA